MYCKKHMLSAMYLCCKIDVKTLKAENKQISSIIIIITHLNHVALLGLVSNAHTFNTCHHALIPTICYLWLLLFHLQDEPTCAIHLEKWKSISFPIIVVFVSTFETSLNILGLSRYLQYSSNNNTQCFDAVREHGV